MQSIGIDIEKIARFQKEKIKSSFLKRVYTAKELHYCFNQAKPAEHLAGRFAAKEAVIKAMALFTKQSISHQDIEVIKDKFNTPFISLKNDWADKFDFSLSISHTKDIAVSVVIIRQK